MSVYSLQNIDNYKTEYDAPITEIFAKYMGLVSIYVGQCVESVSIRDVCYYKYIVFKGLETINHIFTLLLLYTKNLLVTTHYVQQ